MSTFDHLNDLIFNVYLTYDHATIHFFNFSCMNVPFNINLSLTLITGSNNSALIYTSSAEINYSYINVMVMRFYSRVYILYILRNFVLNSLIYQSSVVNNLYY